MEVRSTCPNLVRCIQNTPGTKWVVGFDGNNRRVLHCILTSSDTTRIHYCLRFNITFLVRFISVHWIKDFSSSYFGIHSTSYSL